MRLDAVGKRYGMRQPWVVRDVTADLPAGRLIRVAAISHTTAQAGNPLAANWPGAGSLIGAVCLLAVVWTVSVLAGSRRDAWAVGSG
jgi:hypothetical protein